MRRSTTGPFCLSASIALLVLIGGCFHSNDPVDPDPQPDAYPFADTVEQLMTNFKNAYDEMDIDEYDNALHEEFHFVFADGSYVAPPSGFFTREQDLESTTNMFAGEQGADPDGLPKPGVRDIVFTELTRLSEWEEAEINDALFAGSMRALFDVRVVFYLDTDSVNTITIDCQQLFYVKSETEEAEGGGTRQRFFLFGQQDLD
ncbi:MAG: hypothetical protein Q7W56_04510 [Candidatus Latescibacteria bacterium]|nr:hypothetical protein [Candidatus Latescibacterota bacterium]